eukprot:531428_1
MLVLSETDEQSEKKDEEYKAVELVTKQAKYETTNTTARSICEELKKLLTEIQDQMGAETVESLIAEVKTLFIKLMVHFDNDCIHHDEFLDLSLLNHCAEVMTTVYVNDDSNVVQNAIDILILNFKIIFVNNRNSNVLKHMEISDHYIVALVTINEYLQSFPINEDIVSIMSKHFSVVSDRLNQIDTPLSKQLYTFTFNTLKRLFQYISDDHDDFDKCESAQILFEAAEKYKAKYATKFSHNSIYGKYSNLFADDNGNYSVEENYSADFVSLKKLVNSFIVNPYDLQVLNKIKTILTHNNSNMLLSRHDYDRLTKAIIDSGSNDGFEILFIETTELEYNEDFQLRDDMIEIAQNLNNTTLLLSLKQVEPKFCKFTNVLALASISVQIIALFSVFIVLVVNEIQWDSIYLKNMTINGALYHTNEFIGDSTYQLHFDSSSLRFISELNNRSYTCNCSTKSTTQETNGNVSVVRISSALSVESFCNKQYDTHSDSCSTDYSECGECDSWECSERCRLWDPCRNKYDVCTDETTTYSCFETDSNERGDGSYIAHVSTSYRQILCDDPYWIYGINQSFNSTAYNRYTFSDVKLNWIAANQYCAYNYGTSLAVIYDEHGDDQSIVQCKDFVNDGCWIGARSSYNGKNALNDNFVWFDYRPYVGKNLSIANYSNWHTLFSKNNFNKIRAYVHKDLCAYLSQNGSWMFSDCNEEKYFLCNNPWWFTPWLFYYDLNDNKAVIPSNWNVKMLWTLGASIEAADGSSSTGIVSTMWDNRASGDIYFFGVISTLILFTYFLKETTQLSELWYLILLAKQQNEVRTAQIGYVFYALSVILLISASLASISLMVKTSDVIGVLSSVVSVVFVLDIDDWIGYFIKHKFSLTSSFYVIKKLAPNSSDTTSGKCSKITPSSLSTESRETQSCCVIAVVSHAWSQIWLLQLWTVLLAYMLSEYTAEDVVCQQHSSLIGWLTVLTIGVWIITFIYVDSPSMVYKGWIFSSGISGWLFLLIYTLYAMADCPISDADSWEIILFFGFFSIISGGMVGILFCPMACCICICNAYFAAGGRLQ